MRTWVTAAGAAAVLSAAGCGPAPYTIGPDDPATVEIAARGPEQGDSWVPQRSPRANPFVHRRVWRGVYDCPQGRTDLTLRVIEASDVRVRAIFDFHHVPSGAAGQYFVLGPFDPESGRVTLVPGPWIDQPDGYVSVGMEGQVSADGHLFSGRIAHPSCGSFRVQPGSR